MSEEFKKLLVENRKYKPKESPLSIAIWLIISAFFIGLGVILSSFYSIFPIGLGIGLIIGMITSINRGRKEAVPESFWIDMIQNNPDNIVWIKPITNKVSVSAIPVMKTYNFVLYTKDKHLLTLFCVSDSELDIFWRGIKTHLTNTHIGYSADIENIYEETPENFIESLKLKELYRPVSSL